VSQLRSHSDMGKQVRETQNVHSGILTDERRATTDKGITRVNVDRRTSISMIISKLELALEAMRLLVRTSGSEVRRHVDLSSNI